VDGDLKAAIALYEQAVAAAGSNRLVAARALVQMGQCYEKLGSAEAQKAYQRVVRDFADQAEPLELARTRLAALAAALHEQASGPAFRKIAIPGDISSGAQLSRDGATLAMASGRDIWIVSLRGQVSPEIAGVPERLTHGANAAATGLTWSGNGQWIAYNEYTIPTRNMTVLPVSGGAPRRLVRPVPLLGNSPWWLGLSSDGSRLAYTTIEAQQESLLQIVSVATGDLVMRVGNSAATEPRFSPDDTRVAYVRQLKGGSQREAEVRVVRLADRTDFPITETPMLFRSPAWSPDGSSLAFLVHPDKNDLSAEEVWIAPAMRTGEAAARPTKTRLTRFAESIAGWTSDNRIGLLSRSPSHNAIYTVPVSGGKATQVTPDGDTFLPQWSPDGARIYFRWGRNGIGSVPAAGGQVSEVPVTAEDLTVTLPGGGVHVSPDGQRIVFSGVKKGIPGPNLWTVPITGGQPVQLTMKTQLKAWQPRWSPDGQWIAFESERAVSDDRKLDENIFIVSARGGEPRQLTRHSDCFCELMAWSPGGDSIAYACSDAIIRITPAGGGEPRTVLKVDGLEHHQGSLAWTADGARLLYTAKGRLWTVSVAGGEPTPITTGVDGNILQFALSPDGKRIAFNAPSGGDLEVWLMEDFLPSAKDEGVTARKVIK